jgi:hypothetical protein
MQLMRQTILAGSLSFGGLPEVDSGELLEDHSELHPNVLLMFAPGARDFG